MQDINISPRSTSKLVKDDDQSEDAKGNAKRKRTPAREKVSVPLIILYSNLFFFECPIDDN